MVKPASAGEAPTTWHGGSVLENAYPSWNFLWKQIKEGEDVELAIYGVKNSRPGACADSHRLEFRR